MTDSKAKNTKVDVIEVIQHGDAIILPDPEKLPLKRAIEVLQRKMEYDDQMVALHAEIPGFLPDALNAFNKTLSELFGWVNNVPTPGFFGPQPPVMVAIETSPGKIEQVPYGRFQLPGIDGFLETGAEPKDGRFILIIGGEIKRRNEARVNEIVEKTKAYLRDHSVYRGQAWSYRGRDERGRPKPMPEPKFIHLQDNLLDELVFSRDVMEQIETSIFTPIIRTNMVREHGIPLKRGVLLSGPYGTGKSMTSAATAVLAVRHGWTFISCDRADELSDVLLLAREYQPCVVFCEDIDRVTAGQRSIDMDEILNVIDGVESKGSELMIVLTTNHLEAIHRAMLRPGRLDAVIHVDPPDPEAVQRLMRQYGRGLIEDGTDLTEAAEILQGQKPSTIREVTERAKLAAIKRTTSDTDVLLLTSDSLRESAVSMRRHIEEMEEPKPDLRTPVEKAADTLAHSMEKVSADAIEQGVALNQPFLPIPLVSDLRGAPHELDEFDGREQDEDYEDDEDD